jgi:hypothetical protein
MAFDHLKFPFTKYHPVLGKRVAEKQDDLDKVFVGPEHNWFDTPEEADMHRTATDAALVLHNSTRMRVDALVSEADPDSESPDLAEQFDIGTVVNSVQHHEYVVKPLLEAPTEEERQAQADRVEAAAEKSRKDAEASARANAPVHTEASPG